MVTTTKLTVSNNESGYFSLPIFFGDVPGCKILYCKPNSLKNDEDSKTLFVANCNDISEGDFKKLFGSYGDIEDIQLGKLAKGDTQVAYIKFSTKAQVQNVIDAIQSENPPTLEQKNTRISFFQESLTECRGQYMDTKSIKEQAFKTINDYNEQMEAEENQPTVDEDGWTIVRKKRSIYDDNEDEPPRVFKKPKTKGTLQNFYRFQIRENKRDQLMKLREQFENDKEKINKMKNSRKFNPL
ncbi:hypothetical protein WA158_004423 [Blastocystis sp. Blastoise]